jgi:hypothetical protein
MISNLWALIKAVPVLITTFKQLVDLYVSEQVKAIRAEHITIDDQKNALLKAIENAQTNEEILAHSVTLRNLNRG